jgi:hypothetical protein
VADVPSGLSLTTKTTILTEVSVAVQSPFSQIPGFRLDQTCASPFQTLSNSVDAIMIYGILFDGGVGRSYGLIHPQ